MFTCSLSLYTYAVDTLALEFVWSQEEPENMGPWTFIQPRFAKQLGYQASIVTCTCASILNEVHVYYTAFTGQSSPICGFCSGCDKNTSAGGQTAASGHFPWSLVVSPNIT